MNKAYELAKLDIGTCEWRDGSNPKVAAYFADAGHPEVKDDDVAWCAAFVGAVLWRSGIPSTGSLLARSYVDWGDPVNLADAQEGDIVVFKRGNSSWQGHVGFFVKNNGATITVLGGNQGNMVKRQSYPASSLIAVRRAPMAAGPVAVNRKPASTPLPKDAPSPTVRPFGLWGVIFGAIAACVRGFRK